MTAATATLDLPELVTVDNKRNACIELVGIQYDLPPRAEGHNDCAPCARGDRPAPPDEDADVPNRPATLNITAGPEFKRRSLVTLTVPDEQGIWLNVNASHTRALRAALDRAVSHHDRGGPPVYEEIEALDLAGRSSLIAVQTRHHRGPNVAVCLIGAFGRGGNAGVGAVELPYHDVATKLLPMIDEHILPFI
jgi:hypothetical protein